jgi:hypothetical protein
VPFGGLGDDEAEVVTHLRDAGFAGDGSVPRHDRGQRHVQQQVTRVHPPLRRAGPHDRRAVDEQDVPGEHDPRVRHVHQHVTGGVRRTDLDQLHLAAADIDRQPARERSSGRDNSNVVEPERREYSCRVRSRPPAQSRQGGNLLHRVLGDQPGGGTGGDDLDTGRCDQLVAEAMVAVGVGVHHGRQRRAVGQRPDPVEHLPRRDQVEQRVYQQRGPAACHQPGVAPAPAAVRLQPGMTPVAQIMQSL